MPIPRRYTTEAIVLSRFDLGEADRVLTLITPDVRQAQGHRQGRPAAHLAARRQPRAVRRADRRPRPRPDLRRRDPGERRPRLAAACATPSRAPRRPGTSPSLPTAASRSATRPSRCTPCSRRAYELLDAGMAPGRVARWYEMHLLDELGIAARGRSLRRVRPDARVGRAVPLGAAARRRRLRALPRSAARPDRPDASTRSSCSRPTSASTSRPSPSCAWPPSWSARSRPHLRDFVRVRLERDARSLAVPRRGPRAATRRP